MNYDCTIPSPRKNCLGNYRHDWQCETCGAEEWCMDFTQRIDEEMREVYAMQEDRLAGEPDVYPDVAGW